jgi:hypothetical protein
MSDFLGEPRPGATPSRRGLQAEGASLTGEQGRPSFVIEGVLAPAPFEAGVVKGLEGGLVFLPRDLAAEDRVAQGAMGGKVLVH